MPLDCHAWTEYTHDQDPRLGCSVIDSMLLMHEASVSGAQGAHIDTKLRILAECCQRCFQ